MARARTAASLRIRKLRPGDYNIAATRLWIALAIGGIAALLHAAMGVAGRDSVYVWQVLGWTGIVAVAAAFPVQIPRSKYWIAPGDIVVFMLLALFGSPPAVLAAAAEGFIGAIRSTARLSNRIASLAAAASAMTISGMVFGAVKPWLGDHGLAGAAAQLVALTMAAIAYYAIVTIALMQLAYLKRGERLTPGKWFGNTSWVGTLYLVSAVVAGLLSLNAQQSGRSTSVVSVLVIALSVVLVRMHFRRQVAEHEAQEARVAAAERDAERNQKRFHAAFTSASIGMAIVSPGGVTLQVNQALCALLGFAPAQLMHLPFSRLLQPSDVALLDRHVAGLAQRSEDRFSIELRCLGGDGRDIWVSLHCAHFGDRTSADAGFIYQLHDITSRRRAERELHHIAYHDGLTDLANRNCFHERLRVAVERSSAGSPVGFAVMCLDLDRFKTVNDSMGHPAGDELLKEVAHRLAGCIRPQDLVARLGGDEFAILVEEVRHRDDAVELGRRLLRALAEPAFVNGTEVRPQASIGVTFSDLGYREPDEMLRDADIAMYKAKADGKGRIALFDAHLHAELGHKLQLEADLRRAIGDGQLSLVFQPLFDLEPFRLNGFEALARWTHPVRGVISPAVFVPLAEETGNIESLTAWAIDEAVRQLAVWRSAVSGVDNLVMHVNVSGTDLARRHLAPHVGRVLERHRLPPQLLTLEITETTLMEQRGQTLHSLAALRDLGVRLGIDDFGTGYSSLAYLSTLPFDCLKIDQSFVAGMRESPQNVEIIRAVLSLGDALNKVVIAEGIETHEQLVLLRQLGTPVGQGYLLAQPMAPAQVRDLLEVGGLLRAPGDTRRGPAVSAAVSRPTPRRHAGTS